jgi:hypothetical protein
MIKLERSNGAKEDRIQLGELRVFLYCYLAQAGIGFAVGLAIPWLHLFGVIR